VHGVPNLQPESLAEQHSPQLAHKCKDSIGYFQLVTELSTINRTEEHMPNQIIGLVHPKHSTQITEITPRDEIMRN
jgi:hypothetical protein